MIKRLLIANRGEIARRIIRTCRANGIETVAVYSDADANLAHVREADMAVRLGPAPARESYLDISKVMAAAVSSGADAVHPGYGFLSENTAFAAACTEAGIIFVGPPAKAIELMGDKAAARKLMTESGVPVLPGCDQDIRDDNQLLEEAKQIGFPLLVKAVAGGGGKGMRVVHREADFIEALHSARREAKAAFGDDRVLLERYLSSARHIEVQVFADQHGQALHLFERDCSVQRRHQKIIEEAPAPGLTESQRIAVGEAAVQAAQAIDYVGAGTVEFLFADGHFYFMEMNTRLQVEHPVTEMITGEDLVWWQLCVASGNPLPKRQHELRIHGAAMEVRIYAEDPWQNFMPSSGLLNTLVWPHGNARVDSGYEQGDRVESFYDPMIAKIICHGEDRDAARQKLMQALSTTMIDGIHHNCGFLYQVLGSAAFANAELDTRLLERHAQLMEKPHLQPELVAVAAAAALTDTQPGGDPWQSLNGWRPFARQLQQYELMVDGNGVLVQINVDGHQCGAKVNGEQRTLHWHKDQKQVSLAWGSDTLKAQFIHQHNGVLLNVCADSISISDVDSRRGQQQHGSRHAPFAAPMSGTVVALHVAPGAAVSAGTAVVTMEAMKMEHTLRAPADGIISDLLASIGEQVSEGALLAQFEPGQAEQP
ncbi:biotin carboxylase N-terminal domain-containing protein [Alcanivorax sp. 1008]|uniref:acetyl/propionyl/methylcrotonyl-CoA carboxylase subunit alpha n=1 Tax=Alcanivorax sp. 1008 TaxID=2816853 RepID=UPI001D403CBD|nr:biotin carboxylase N-terminal domain-containing protein [Alcanivorax sp. 1008]MCC1496359.1 ATP-grasp domain-containing protein [Alcanivorax sp. 1008]